jgi:hypothetical protein
LTELSIGSTSTREICSREATFSLVRIATRQQKGCQQRKNSKITLVLDLVPLVVVEKLKEDGLALSEKLRKVPRA